VPSLLDKIERVPVDSLTLYPGNARKGDIKAIAASLAENGQVSPLIVQASTRYVLGGNHTLQAAQSLGWTHIDVVRLDVDDQRAAKINVALNRTADLGEYDDTALLAQLADLDDLAGTGYILDDLDELRRITGVLGADATSFLDPFTNPPPPDPLPGGPQPPVPPGGSERTTPDPDGSGAPPGPTAPEWVQLAWTVTPGSRETIRRAVHLAQQRNELATAAEGLLAMATYYLTTTE
jgi:hypothetical protein